MGHCVSVTVMTAGPNGLKEAVSCCRVRGKDGEKLPDLQVTGLYLCDRTRELAPGRTLDKATKTRPVSAGPVASGSSVPG